MTPIQQQLRPAIFTMDVFEAASSNSLRRFSGLTSGERWNGWACPYFTHEQAQSLVVGWKALGAEAHYEVGTDEFVFSPIDQAEEENERYGAVEIAGQRLYPIGTHSWTWDEVFERAE